MEQMKLSYNLNLFNNNTDFLLFRERNTRIYVYIMIGIGISMVSGFYYLDNILKLHNLHSLLYTRTLTSTLLAIISFIQIIFIPNRIRHKIHLYAGFYVLAIYSSVLSHFAGGIQSSYWAGLNFTLIFWLTLVPFPYKEIITNSFVFVFIYDLLLLTLNTAPIPWDKFIEYHFFFFGTIMVGSTVTYLTNKREVIIYLNQLELEIERNKLKSKNNILESDVALARKIQFQLIPEPDPTEYIYSLYKPMQEVGGDLYDFIHFRDSNKIGIFISDVSGHGVPAAFITSMIKTTILQSGVRKENPAELMHYINDVLQNQTADNFITAFYGIYDPDNRSLLYSNAGHPQPYLITEHGIIQLPKGRGTALAIFPNSFLAEKNKPYRNFEETLPSDSKLLLYTDGMTEASPINSNVFFEDESMMDVFMENRNNSSKLFIEKLYKSLIAFKSEDSFEDDVCLVCLDVI